MGSRLRARLAEGALQVLAAMAFVAIAHAQDATTLHARQAARGPALASSPFQRALVIESTQTDGVLKGDVYAVVAYPYDVVGEALQGMDRWCDILMLHLNVKDCRASGPGGDSILTLVVGRRFDQPVQDAYTVDFVYRVASNAPEYLELLLDADAGPLGTKDYRLVFEAVPIDAASSFVHMSYSYAYGMVARLAMQGYLATIGRNKVGFSVVARKPDGTPVYMGGVRGVVERNTMRYYLAIEAYLGAYTLPAAQQPEKRLRDWFTAIERYPRQLHELEREEYLSMKRRELARRATRSANAL